MIDGIGGGNGNYGNDDDGNGQVFRSDTRGGSEGGREGVEGEKRFVVND